MDKNIVCTNKQSFHSYDHHWQEAGIKFDYLTDITWHPLDVGIQYSEQSVRNVLNLGNLQVSKKHYWNSYGNRNIIWFYAHFRMLYYYIANPDYNYYWFFDDDVTIQDWNTFFKGFVSNRSDFISMYCFKDSDVNSQPNIPHIDDKTTSQHMWFERFPGDGDKLPEGITEKFGSFFPIVRLSNNALRKLKDLIEQGIYGYSEGFVPTVLNYYNYSLDTIFDKNSQSKYFNDDIVKVKHKHIKIDWSWI